MTEENPTTPEENKDGSLASDKPGDQRTPEEQKAAEATAVAKAKEDAYKAALKAEADALKLANKNDPKPNSKVDIGVTDRLIREKLVAASNPVAKAQEHENYVREQALYQNVGLSAQQVAATVTDTKEDD